MSIIIILLIIFIFSYLTHHYGKTFYDNRIKNGKLQPKIFDISHKYLPNYSSNLLLISLMDIIILLPLLFGKKFITEYLNYYLVILLIRFFTTFVTILPKTKNCDDSNFTILNFLRGHCYDKVFSGHFASSFLFIILLYHLNIYRNLYISTLFLLFHAFLILSTRSHYTIDLIVSIFVVLTVFNYKLKFNLS